MEPSGYGSKAGIILAQTWGSDTWTAVDTLLPMVSETLTQSYDDLRSKALIGQAAAHERFNGTEMVAGDLVLELCYAVGADLIGYGMGAFASGVATFANDLTSGVFNLEIDKGQERMRFYNCMVDKVVIAGGFDGNPMTATLGIVARRAAPVATAFPSLSLPATDNATRVYMEHLRTIGLWIGDLDNVLASSDEVGISTFELTIENANKVDDKDSSDTKVLQLIRDNWRTVTMKLGLPRYSDTTDNFLVWKEAATRLQCLSVWTSPSGGTIALRLPHLKVSDGADFNVGGPGVISGEVTLEAFYNGGINTNTGMSTITDQGSIDFSLL